MHAYRAATRARICTRGRIPAHLARAYIRACIHAPLARAYIRVHAYRRTSRTHIYVPTGLPAGLHLRVYVVLARAYIRARIQAHLARAYERARMHAHLARAYVCARVQAHLAHPYVRVPALPRVYLRVCTATGLPAACTATGLPAGCGYARVHANRAATRARIYTRGRIPAPLVLAYICTRYFQRQLSTCNAFLHGFPMFPR